jgi:intracellular sulfur oxidation DsrE/DsrF family protein
MHRRNILSAAVAAIGGVFAASAINKAKAEVPPAAPKGTKVVYHLADADKVDFVLGNIDNHFNGVGGRENVTIALVVHGPALKSFHANGAKKDIQEKFAELSKTGVELNACGNTMKQQKVTLADLLPGFVKAEEGGVVRLVEYQVAGYHYLRP